MTTVESALRRIVADLAQGGRDFALVGGLGISARTDPRFTRDADLVVSVADDEGAEQVLRDLMTRGYVLVATVEHDEANRLATARLASPVAPDEQLIVDLLFASSGVEPEIAARAEPLEVLEGLVVPIAVIGDLLALKLLSRDDDTRPQDAGDIRTLVAAATADDLALARETVTLITARGYARGRDLAAALDRLAGGG
jgi:predicted nucleotidyltransferase